MSQISNTSRKYTLKSGFTLIELLVVIAIIGVLASVVLASLNTARTKGQIAAIKSNLKNMIPQAELSYSDNGSYSGINAANANTICIGSLANIAQSITNLGATVRCLSYNNPAHSSDEYPRYGASAIIGTSTPLKAYSVSGTGVTTWDTTDQTEATWTTANNECSNVGGRLPTIEELRTLSQASKASSNNSFIPPSFIENGYWSSTTVPLNTGNAYFVSLNNSGSLMTADKNFNNNVRCVR